MELLYASPSEPGPERGCTLSEASKNIVEEGTPEKGAKDQPGEEDRTVYSEGMAALMRVYRLYDRIPTRS